MPRLTRRIRSAVAAANLHLIALLPMCLALITPADAAERQDIYSFTPPTGWKQQGTESYDSYTTFDPRSGAFCVIGAYASTAGSGNAAADFASEWRTLVQDSLGLALPSDLSERDWVPGWRLRSGSGQVVSTASGTYTTRLYVHSGPGRSFSILVKDAKNGCGAALQGFLSSIRLVGTDAPQPTSQPAEESPSAGERHSLGELGYRVPGDWTLSTSPAFPNARLGRHVELKPRHLYPGEDLTVIIFASQPARPTPEEELRAGWQEVVAELGAEATNNANMKHFDAEILGPFANHSLLAKADGAVDMADGHYDMSLYAVQLQGRTIRVAAVAHWLRGAFLRTSALQNPRFARELPRLLLDLDIQGARLGSRPSKPVDARPLLGVWNGISMFGGQLKVTYANFYPDGRVYFASQPPAQGFMDLDREADALRRGFYWGTYRFDGTRGALTLPGRKSVFPIRLSGSNLVVVSNNTPHNFIRLPAVERYRLQGTYGVRLARGGFATIAFTAGGTFDDAGALALVDHDLYEIKVSKQPGRGHYRISDYTLALDYDDGRRLRLPFLGSSDLRSTTPATLRLGTEDTELVRR